MNVEQEVQAATPETNQDAPPVDPGPSETDLMAEVFDKHIDKDGIIKEEKPAKKEAKAEPEPKEPEKDEKAESAPPKGKEASLEGEEGADEDEGDGSTPADRSESAPAPAHLPKAVKDVWAKLDSDVQKVIEDREREFGAKFGEMGRQIEQVKPLSDKLNGMIEAYPDLKDRTPEQLAQGAAELAAVQMELDKNPVEMVLKIAQTYGVIPQLQQAFSGQQPTNEQATIARLNQQVAQLQRQIQNAPNDQPDIAGMVDIQLQERDAKLAVADFAAKNAQTYGAVENVLPQFIDMARDENPAASFTELLQRGHELAVNAFNVNGATAQEPGKQDTAEAAPDKPEPAKEHSKRTVKAIKAASLPKSSGKSEPPPKTDDELMGDAWDRLNP